MTLPPMWVHFLKNLNFFSLKIPSGNKNPGIRIKEAGRNSFTNFLIIRFIFSSAKRYWKNNWNFLTRNRNYKRFVSTRQCSAGLPRKMIISIWLRENSSLRPLKNMPCFPIKSLIAFLRSPVIYRFRNSSWVSYVFPWPMPLPRKKETKFL